MLDALRRDLRFARRSLWHTPVVTVAAIVSIALGVGATMSVFSLVDAALFRPPPLDHAEQLAALFITRQAPNAPAELERWSWSRFKTLRALSSSFEQVATFSVSVLAITGEAPEPVNAEVVSSSYLSLLRVRPIAGRTFTAGEEDPSAPSVAVIGYDLWQRRYGAERSVVGRTINLNAVPLLVVGILPRGFVGLTGRAQVWVPPTLPPRASYRDYLTTNQNFISVVGRLRPGVTIERAKTELATVGQQIQRQVPSRPDTPGEQLAATAITLNDARVDPSTRRPMLVLLAAVGCLLLLSCANVAGLLMGRAVTRRREIGIRIATGASRSRIIRQLLVEAATLATIGGAAGVLVAVPVTMRLGLPSALWRGRNFYGALGEFSAPRIDARVLLFSLAVCAVTTLAFGLQATQLDLTSALKDGVAGAGQSGRRSGIDVRRLLVGAETCIAMVLLVAGALLAASWHRLAGANVGFDHSHLLTFLIRPSEVKYPPDKAPALITKLLDEIQRDPGVEAASVDGCTPVGTGCANSQLLVMGRANPRPDDAPLVLRHYVGPNHFRTLKVPVLRGREFDAGDRAGGPRVAIISQTAARRFWPNEDPIGQRVWFNGGSNFDRPDSSAEIVGIVGDVAYQALDEHPFQPDFYTPYTQFTYASRTVLVRTRREPGAMVDDMRRIASSVDPTLALFDVRTMEQVMGDSWARLSYQTKVLGGFAVVALLLAATGIFAIVAHVISERRREIGIRVALGASRLQVLAAVAESGAKPAVVGLMVGGIAAAAIGRVLASVVFGVRAFDPLVMGGVSVALALVIVCAVYLAARRALAVNPVEALR